MDSDEPSSLWMRVPWLHFFAATQYRTVYQYRVVAGCRGCILVQPRNVGLHSKFAWLQQRNQGTRQKKNLKKSAQVRIPTPPSRVKY
jgi:hypothetical protein